MPQGVTIEFDLTDALRSDFETLIATFRQAKALGIFTGDEMRELGGLERTGEADMQKRYVDIQTLPVDKIEDYAESLIQKNKNLGKKNDTRP